MKTLTRDELMDELAALGFRMGETVSKKWRVALAGSTDSHTMVVLVRARGIDLLITPLAIGDMLDSQGRLSVSSQRQGDRYVEYNYTESEAPVHWQALTVASLFVQQQQIDDSYFRKVGIGRSEWAGKHGAKAQERDEGSMSELYQALGHGDGEPVYLSDGVWLGADGSLKDEG